MTLNLSQKEYMLLQDQKRHEELCIQKYQAYAQQAQDPQLKQLFNTLAQQEQQHLDTVNQLLSGQVPNLQQGQSQSGNQQNQYIKNAQNAAPGKASQNDIDLCNDMLITERYISGTYDQTIFETTNSNVRQVLNHIQKEEQQHGEAITNYLQSQGMYNMQ